MLTYLKQHQLNCISVLIDKTGIWNMKGKNNILVLATYKCVEENVKI